MKTVAISRTSASGGEEIGRLVAHELGYRYVDDEVLEVWPESHWPGFCATPIRRIPVLCGTVVHVLR